MKSRQYKKLCKKAAEVMGLNNCGVYDGIHYLSWSCSSYEDEWDSEDAWPYLVNMFDSEVNTIIDDDSECGISWKGKSEQTKSTPKNVFKWAREGGMKNVRQSI